MSELFSQFWDGLAILQEWHKKTCQAIFLSIRKVSLEKQHNNNPRILSHRPSFATSMLKGQMCNQFFGLHSSQY